jgi:hypothetical protein
MLPSIPDTYLYYHLLIPTSFWLVVVFVLVDWCSFKFNFVIPIVTRIDGMTPPPPPHSKPAAQPLKHPSYQEH